MSKDDATHNAPSAASETEETMLTMDELMAQYEATEPLQELREGDVVTGTIVQIDESCAMVDVGTKSEGMIQKSELDEIRHEIKVGDQVQVAVKRIEDEDGNLIVSKRQADYERAWEDIVVMEQNGEIIDARVIEAVKGGLLVDLKIYGQGFVPASHVSIRRPRNLQKYVDQTLRLKVIEVERKRKRVVLSHRKVLEEERAVERDETLGNLGEGQVRRGIVRRITDFGAFVDIGGVDGLLHISEMSWNRIDDPGEVLKVNDEVEVMVLKLNLDEGRISLGLRQLQNDPWREIPKIYRDGQIVRARINKVLNDGLMVRLPIGVDAFVPVEDELLHPKAETESDVAAPADVDEAPAESIVGAIVDEALAEDTTTVEPVLETVTPADVAVEADAPVVADDEVEAAESAEADVEVEAEAGVEAEAEAEAEAEVVEAIAEVAPVEDKPAFEVGAELDVRIDQIVPVERELMLSLASSQPVVERRETASAAAARTSRYAESGAPLARGRYSDRAQREEEDRYADARNQPSPRRERSRREPDRDEQRSVPMPEKQPQAATTLGDLMGDKLRALFGGDDAKTDSSKKTEDPVEAAEEDDRDTAN